MTTTIIDGRAIAKSIHESLQKDVATLGVTPTLLIILANDLDASAIYVRRKMKACEEVGIKPILKTFPQTTPQADIIQTIIEANQNPDIHGIFVQLPVFDGLCANNLIAHIDPAKDIDGLTPYNLGLLISGDDAGLVACTPQGVMGLLKDTAVDLTGKHAVIIGRSLLFGKPMGQLLLQADCTVTQCHSKTTDIQTLTAMADIVIAAVGQPKMVKGDWVKNGAIVIDVGISKDQDGHIVGDVDFDDVKDKASFITPVPGGVGPMTVASLLSNIVKACKTQTNR